MADETAGALTVIAPKRTRGGSLPGERRGGRQKGVVNESTGRIRLLARQHAPAALEELARLATKGKAERTRIAAIKEILNRAYGRSPQPLVGVEDEDSPIRTCVRVEFV